MPGLLRGVARTAVIAGTATHVSNNVSRRQANRWQQQGQSQPGYMAPVETGPAWTERLIGHEAAEQAFLKAFAAGRLPHAWLISGPQGVGKATFAYRIARFLLSQPMQAEEGGLFGGEEPLDEGLAHRPPVGTAGSVSRDAPTDVVRHHVHVGRGNRSDDGGIGHPPSVRAVTRARPGIHPRSAADDSRTPSDATTAAARAASA